MAEDNVISRVIEDVQEIDLAQELGLDTGEVIEAAPAKQEPKEATEPKEKTIQPVEPAPKEESTPKEDSTPKENEASTTPKEDVVKDLLSELLEANTPKKAPEPMTEDEQSELVEVKARLESLEAGIAEKEEATAIVDLLNGLSKEEAELLKPDVLKLVKSDIYLKLTKAEFTAEEKAATFLAMATKLHTDEIAALKVEQATKAVEVEQKAKSIASTQSNTGNISASEQKNAARLAAANDGDLDALGDILLDEFDLEKGIIEVE